jgi:hypothetical protein
MEANEILDMSTRSAEEQIRLAQKSLNNNLDAADRIAMRKASEAVVSTFVAGVLSKNLAGASA